jgi:hypothetical protein
VIERSVGTSANHAASPTSRGADRAEHAQGSEAAASHHGEPCHRQQADEQEAKRGEDQHHRLREDRGARTTDTGGDPGPAGKPERLQSLPGRVEKNRDAGRWVGLPGRDERELVEQVEWVLDQTDDAKRPAALVPHAPDMQAEVLRHAAGHRNLAGTRGEAARVEAHRHVAEGPVRILGPDVDGGHRAGNRDLLVVDDLRSAEPMPDGGDVRG